MQVSDSRTAQASAQRSSISGTTKTFVLTPHQLMDISFTFDAAPICVRHLQRKVVSEDVQLQVGDLLVSIAGREVLESSGDDVKKLLLTAMQQSEVRLVFMSSSPVVPQEGESSGIQDEDPLTEVEEDGEWRPLTSEDVRRAEEHLKRSEASQPEEKRASVMLKAQSTVVCLNVNDDPECGDAIKWGFDAGGAFLKRFSSKTTPAVDMLSGLLAPGARLQSINGTTVSEKPKEEILDVWHEASAKGPLELSFNRA